MASISVELSPFPVPTGVHIVRAPGLRQDGFQPSKPMALTELSPIVLDALCEEFRTAVFEAAGYNPQFKRHGIVSDDERADVLPGSQEALNRR